MTTLAHPLTINTALGIDILQSDNGPDTDYPDAPNASKAYNPSTGDWFTKKSSGWIQDGVSAGGSASWDDLTDKPTTRDDFGLTDVYTEDESDARYLQLSGGSLTGTLNEVGSASDTTVHQTLVTGDTFARLRIEASGLIAWGSGSATADVNLYRAGANLLATDDAIGLRNEVALAARNVADDGWIDLIYLDGSNNVNVGNGGIVISSAGASFPANIAAVGSVTAASATIRGYPVMRVRHSAMSGGVPGDMVEGEVWFGTVS